MQVPDHLPNVEARHGKTFNIFRAVPRNLPAGLEEAVGGVQV